MGLDDIPMETEDGINLDHPIVKIFRKTMLEHAAEKEESDLVCPKCKTHLPYTLLTCARINDGIDADMSPVYRTANFCTLCEIYFDNKTGKILEV